MSAPDEKPLPKFKPRKDAKTFSESDTEKFYYEHQHTRGWGPIQTCIIVEQDDDGYCKVITGPGRGTVPSTAIAWSGCLTKGMELVGQQFDLINAYRKHESK